MHSLHMQTKIKSIQKIQEKKFGNRVYFPVLNAFKHTTFSPSNNNQQQDNIYTHSHYRKHVCLFTQ